MKIYFCSFTFVSILALETACRSCGNETIKFLSDLKQGDNSANSVNTKENLEKILATAKVCFVLCIILLTVLQFVKRWV